MNPKIIAAFAAGVAASGAVFYFATNRQSAPPVPAIAQVAAAKPVEPPRTPAPEPQKAADPERAQPPAPYPRTPEPLPSTRRDGWPSAARTVARSTTVAPAAAASIPATAIRAATSNMEPARESSAAPRQSAEAPDALTQPSQALASKTAEAAKVPDVPKPEPQRPVEVSRREPVPLTPLSSASLPPPPPDPRKVTLSGGTLFTVRLTESLSSERNKSGDTFGATLDQPVIVDGLVIAERGSHVDGRIVEAEKGGRMKGTSRLQLELTRFTSSDGQMVGVRTASYDREGSGGGTAKSDVTKVAIGAAAGAVLGAILGGGKGAGIGAATGGAAGGGVVLAARGKPVEVQAETRLTFRLSEPVVMTEKLDH